MHLKSQSNVLHTIIQIKTNQKHNYTYKSIMSDAVITAGGRFKY